MNNIGKRMCAFVTACIMCFSMVMPTAAEDVPLIIEEEVLTAPQESEFIEDIQVSDITQIEPETDMLQMEAETSAEAPLQTEAPQTELAASDAELTETEVFIDETMTEVSETEPLSQGETEGMLKEIPFTDSEIVLEQIEEVSETETDEQTAAELSNQEWEYYILDETEKTVAIGGYNGTETVLEIPSEIMVQEEYWDPEIGENKTRETAYTVVGIGGSAFSGRSNLTEVKIPDTVTSISYEAFYECKNLTSVTLGSGVGKIESSAFCDCSKLRKINFPDNLRVIERYAFSGTALVFAEIPNSVTEIGKYAFSNSRIRMVVLPQSLTKIEEGVFEGSKLNRITIPNSVKAIEGWAFRNCFNLTEVKGGGGLTHISDDAFNSCRNLNTIELSGEIEYVGKGAFENTAWYNNILNGGAYLGHVFYGYNGEMPENSTWSVKTGTSCIAADAFKSQHNLTAVSLPESIKSIGDEAFFDTGMKYIYIPASVTKIALEAIGYGESGIVPDFTIYGYAGTAAQVYANEEGIPFVEWNRDITQCEILGIEDSYKYTGNEIVPEIMVINQGMKVLSDNYEVSCQNNIELGTATVVITGKGALTGSVTKTFKILPVSIGDCNVSGIKESYMYTGANITPDITVEYNGKVIEPDNYTISYKDNIQVGTATVVITGKGTLTGNITKTFKITGTSLQDCEITGISSSYTYTGASITPGITVKYAEKIVPSDNYNVSYRDNVKIGTATVVITGKGVLTGSITKTFKILPASIGDCSVSGIEASYTYTGANITPDITVKYNGKAISSDSYTVSYKDNVNVGTATVVITGKGALTGSITKTFKILPISIKKCSISGLEKPFNYTGKSIRPKITVEIGNETVSSANYIVSYKNNKKIGKATVTIEGKGCLTGNVKKTFVIQPKLTVKNTKYTKTVGDSCFKLNAKANGKAKLKYTSDDKKVVTVKDGKVFIKGSGKAVITVSATANGIKAVKRVYVTVEPKKMVAPSLKAKKSNLTVSWKRASSSVGYELQYSTNKKFTRSTTKTVVLKKSTLTKKTLSKLPKNTYYVRIRACGRDGVKGSWSKTVKAKVTGK